MKYFGSSLSALCWLVLFSTIFLVLLSGAFAQQPSSSAQTPAPPTDAPPAQLKPMAPLPTIKDLKVIPLAGDGEMNDLERKVMAPLVIEVLDQNDKPVESADVVFRFPLKGPSALFPGDKTSQRVRTNGQGQASAVGWIANNEVGTFDVHVTATYGNQLGETTVSMSNVTRITDDVKKKKGKNQSFFASRGFKIAAIAGGAALVAGIVLATRGGAGKVTPSPSPPTITITPGSPTVGGPR